MDMRGRCSAVSQPLHVCLLKPTKHFSHLIAYSLLFYLPWLVGSTRSGQHCDSPSSGWNVLPQLWCSSPRRADDELGLRQQARFGNSYGPNHSVTCIPIQLSVSYHNPRRGTTTTTVWTPVCSYLYMILPFLLAYPILRFAATSLIDLHQDFVSMMKQELSSQTGFSMVSILGAWQLGAASHRPTTSFGLDVASLLTWCALIASILTP